MEEKLEKTTCVSCGESVLSTEKFCKNCGKPLEQKNDNNVNVVEENPDKMALLTFEALDDKSVENAMYPIKYSVEVDGYFIGEINPGEKLDTFVTKGKHNIVLKRNRSIAPVEEQISVEGNQTILLYSLYNLYYLTPSLLINSSDLEKEKILQYNKKTKRKWTKVALIFVAVSVLLFIAFLFTV